MKIMNNFSKIAAVTVMVASVILPSCKDEETIVDLEPGEPEVTKYYNLAAEITGNDGVVYIATTDDLTTGSLTFEGNGLELSGVRAARVMASGDYVYNLDYGGGKISQYVVESDGTYTYVNELNISVAIGTDYPRARIVDENTMLCHNIVATFDYEEDGVTVSGVTSMMSVIAIKLPELTIETVVPAFEVVETAEALAEDEFNHVWRVACPEVSGDKVYYGAARKSASGVKAGGLETIVLDYPSLTNPVVVRSGLDVTGENYGYRGKSMNCDENGDVYQVNNYNVDFPDYESTDGNLSFTRLRDGVYDDSYQFNLSEIFTDSKISGLHWYYAGNGIGYVPVCNQDLDGDVESNTWYLARVDLYNKTAVKLNVPDSDLFRYQSGIVVDNSFFMSIAPVGGEAKVYNFDITSTSADGFTEGLELDNASSVYVQGVY